MLKCSSSFSSQMDRNILMRPTVLQILLLFLFAYSYAAMVYIISVPGVSSYCAHPSSHAPRKRQHRKPNSFQELSKQKLLTQCHCESVDNTLPDRAALAQKHKRWHKQ